MAIGCEACKDKLYPPAPNPYIRCAICGRDLTEAIQAPQTRTNQQNKSIHVFCELLAAELNSAGLDMREVLKPTVDIPWTKQTVKDYIWKPIQQAYLKKDSSTTLTTKEVSEVYDIINRHLGEKFGVSVPFPSDEMLQ